MPWASRKQQKFMYAKHPELIAKAESEGKNYVAKGAKPKKSTHETKKRHK